MIDMKYKKPAVAFKEALPIGNGYTGVMVYGDLKCEKLSFNDATLWSSYPHCDDKENGFTDLQEIRSLILKGKHKKADRLAEQKLACSWSATYLPLGDVQMRFTDLPTQNYERRLQLAQAIHSISADGVKVEAFASYPKNVVVYRVDAEQPFSVEIMADSLLSHQVSVDDGLNLFGNAPDKIFPLNHDAANGQNVLYTEKKAMAFALRLEIETDGQVEAAPNTLLVNDAKTLTVYAVTETGFQGFDQMPQTDPQPVIAACKKRLRAIPKAYAALKQEHIADFTALYQQQGLTICADTEASTDQIVREARAGGSLEVLSQLMYDFGKYLLISGSRKGTQPLNLQGIWNHRIRPPWSCNYTNNINTQMNYWAASACGLSACIEPLIRMMQEAMVTGAQTAKTMFGAEGFCCNHNMDIWRKTSPSLGSAKWFLSPLCGAWLTNELYRHYRNGELEEYKDAIFKIVRENAAFLMSFLIEYNHTYAICPSSSPENAFRYLHTVVSLDLGTAYDMAIVRESLTFALEIAKDAQEQAKLQSYLEKLYPIQKGKHGIREYHRNYREYEPGHRHFSPLYAFFPSQEIGYNADAEKTKWVSDLFWHRLSKSHQHVGWSAVWAMCLGARLRDVPAEQKVIRHFITNAILDNLFCFHEPNYFQIDGNFGFVAGLNELLVTEEQGKIEFLPAILPEYANGKMENLRIKGAKISFQWQNGQITDIESDRPILVYNRHLSPSVHLHKNVTVLKNE